MKRQEKTNTETKTYLEPKDIALLESAAMCLRDRLLIRMLFHLGCRVSEALSLSVGDVNFTKNEVRLPT
jgi:integrase/recombinase XerD